MGDKRHYFQQVLAGNGIEVSPNQLLKLDAFVNSPECADALNEIFEIQDQLMNKWELKNKVDTVISQHVLIPNGTVGKPYQLQVDLRQWNLNEIVDYDFTGLEEIGLSFDKSENLISGIPAKSGDLKFKFLFKVESEDPEIDHHEKLFPLIINPDPKSLWKDIPSDQSLPFSKPDDVTVFEKMGSKHIVVSSKRGRSHKNIGSFREDDFAFKHFETTGWSVIAVSDGAGSCSLSRKGSAIACSSAIEYFIQDAETEHSREFENLLADYNSCKTEETLKKIKGLGKKILYKATVHVHNSIKKHAKETYENHIEWFDNPKAKSYLDYYHSTLLLTLLKKFDFGYVVLTFGVGDCPIAIMNADQSEATLLNWLDVGEFGGGTRFITQPEIFQSNEHKMETRFNCKIVDDFSFLFLMTDGIYDPKFVVEANLVKTEKWKEFVSDLQGENADNIGVDFDPDNGAIATQLAHWMDFWSQGNHDDRTLAVIF
jgi:hypothetical protein